MLEDASQVVPEELESVFPSLAIKYNVPWERVTTLGIGGEIPIMAEPSDDISLTHLLRYCYKNEVPVTVIGGGSNLAGAAMPFPGIVIRLAQNDFIKVKAGRDHITAGAGVRLYDMLIASAKRGLGGASDIAGIPGTLGGALRMNAEAHGTSIGDFAVDFCGFDIQGNQWCASQDEIDFGYRTSDIPDDVIITAVILRLKRVDKGEELNKIRSELKKRRRKEPLGRSAGCIFRNPSPDTSAGKLIDISGCKGMTCGGMKVSEEHANYLVNTGGATERDFLELAKNVRQKVYDNTGIYLKPEIRFIMPETRDNLLNSIPPVKAAVLKGGNSSEREISLESGGAVANALRSAGYDIDEIDIHEMAVTSEMRNADVVFPVLHGGYGENGGIQELLEKENISFVGCGSKACAIIFDKVDSKELMLKNDIPTPPFCLLASEQPELPEDMSFPLIVKPSCEGSTVGITFVDSLDKWPGALQEAFKYPGRVIVEKYIKGTEVTVGVIFGKPLPLLEIRYPGLMYDYDAKYTHANGETLYLCPTDSVSDEIQKKAQEYAVAFYKASGARDLLRVDMIIEEGTNDIYVIEGNNIPGFTSSSLLPKAAATSGISFTQLTALLMQAAYKRKDK